MQTINQNLTILNKTKEDFKKAFTDKNIETTGKPFSEWPSLINEIKSDGGTNPILFETYPELVTIFNNNCKNTDDIIAHYNFNSTSTKYFDTWSEGKYYVLYLPEIGTITSNCSRLFAGCTSLLVAPLVKINYVFAWLDLMYADCASLLRIEGIKFEKEPKPYNWNGIFKGCINLKSINNINFKYAKDIQDAFFDCRSLEIIEQPFDLSNCTSIGLTAFGNCYSLKEIRFIPETIKYSIAFIQSPLLSDESIASIINGLATTNIGASIHFNINNNIPESLITEATRKGWSIYFS